LRRNTRRIVKMSAMEVIWSSISPDIGARFEKLFFLYIP